MTKQPVFVVEDDKDIAGLVRHHLEGAEFSTRIFSNGRSVISEAERTPPALFVLDVMIPGKDGLELCRSIRDLPSLARTPIIFLTARNSEADRIRGLEIGADDYVSKPFSPRELVARVKALLRRYGPPPAFPVRVGELEVDPLAMTLTIRGKQSATTITEFRLLEHFVRNIGRVFTRDEILDSVWGDTAYVTRRSVDVYVRRVREKIECDPENPAYLKTVRGAWLPLRLLRTLSETFGSVRRSANREWRSLLVLLS